VYPLVDHVADKVMAILQRYGETQAPSTRYKDLVDLVAILSEAPIEVNSQRTALTLADRSQTVDEALAIVRAFLDPVLSGNAEGVWNPKSGRWEI
jgi:Nucleotidyl transferase AbiEii toxin, Type IV TA system